MRILVTGGFGRIGRVTLREALARGHTVTAFARPTGRNRRAARRFKDLAVRWGDMRDLAAVREAVQGQDAVIHLAAVLPPRSDAHAVPCEAVNVGGTNNLITALEAQPGQPRLVFVSSTSVMGPTQHREPPLRVSDPLLPTDAYSRSKVQAEALVKRSMLPWAILRVAAVMPTRGIYDLALVKLVYDMCLEARCEIAVDLDVAYALVRAAESLCDGGAIRGKTVFIAGGRDKGCQMKTADMVAYVLAPLGIKPPREELFQSDPSGYYLDWYDTDEGQAILGYQRHSVDEWQSKAWRHSRVLRLLLWPVRWPAKRFLESLADR